MATTKDIAEFFRLELRLQLATTADVERWADSVIAAGPVAMFPFTELASASRRSRAEVDDLLGQVSGTADSYVPGRMVLARLGQRVREGVLTPEAAIKLTLELGAQALTPDEIEHADWLYETFRLASGVFDSLIEQNARERQGDGLDQLRDYVLKRIIKEIVRDKPYGTPQSVREKAIAFLDRYTEFEPQLPG